MYPNVSEVSRLRTNISQEYQAAHWGLQGFAQGTSKHEFIAKRMEQISAYHHELEHVVGKEKAIAIVAETAEKQPETMSRQEIHHRLLGQGDTEETQIFIDWLRDMWETIDLLVEKFGTEFTYTAIFATASGTSKKHMLSD